MPAMAAAEVQKTLVEALTALYRSPDSSVRNQANHWLQEFQHSVLAWEVSDSLLHDANSNLETLLFCSQTLKTKIQRDFEELPAAAFCPLRDSLYALLKHLSSGPSKVRTQICIALASLAVHVPMEDWGGGGILNWLKQEMNSSPDYMPSFLELLAILPQEAFSYKVAARPERRRQFQNELVMSIGVALDLLTYCLNATKFQEQVLEAFASWLRLNHGISAATLASHPLVVAALSSLRFNSLPDAAVNVICELIRYTVSESPGGLSAQMPLIQVLVPHVMGLRDQFKDPSKDEDDVKAMARLFSDMGDSYVDMIATGSDESMMIVQALLEVAAHPDYDIASMTFNFWHSLQVSLTEWESYSSLGTENAIRAERDRRIAMFRPTFETLISLVAFRVQYPQDYEDLSKEDRRDFRQTRYAVGDIIIDAASVLGGDAVVKILFMNFVKSVGNCEANDWNWRSSEAALYCIRSVANAVPSHEVEVMLQVFAILPKLPHQPQLLQTTCLTIGAYSTWLNASSAALPFLPSIIDILTRGMSASEDSAAAACMAFRHVCDACRTKLCGSLDGLFHIYHRAVSGEGGYRVCAEDSLQLVEALSVVITELSSDQAKKALEALCLQAVNPLQEIINQGVEPVKQLNPTKFTVHIDRLANIFRYVNHPEAVGDAFERIWPLFKAIFDYRAWDMRTMEALCRACKYAVRTSGQFIVVTIGDMLSVVQEQYQLHHQPCFLYLSSEVIKIFGSEPSCANYLGCLIESLFRHTTHLLTKIEEFTARPDIADDCFLLASRCIRYCPHIFVPSSIFSSLVDCSIVGITVQHREACNSILTFMSDVLDLASSVNGQDYRAMIDSVVLPRGSIVTRILVASITGALPTSRLEEVSYVLRSLTRAYGLRACEWAKEAILLIPSTAVTESESSRFLNALSKLASEADSSALFGPLEELSDVCRRNRAVQESVQGALKPHQLNFVRVS
ncbi:transportin MOS14 isoform X2 [Nymphaea colorata]|uniref:transportin MOS14 isoform X2 n=1 Tax=Nymphaea colorata TaxID=210225 RepID=UPI00129E4771|nr:transportin MOS14 isoform X2 [Nymphaea colorata]